MLLWSAICFGFLALANLFVVLDMLVFPDVDLRSVRLVAVAGGGGGASVRLHLGSG